MRVYLCTCACPCVHNHMSIEGTWAWTHNAWLDGYSLTVDYSGHSQIGHEQDRESNSLTGLFPFSLHSFYQRHKIHGC